MPEPSRSMCLVGSHRMRKMCGAGASIRRDTQTGNRSSPTARKCSTRPSCDRPGDGRAATAHELTSPIGSCPVGDPDAELLAALRAGDETAFATLVGRYQMRMLRL